MNAHRALVFLALLATAFFARAGESVTIEPRAPSSYSATRPAYLFFKKIVITRQSKTTYDFDITLQGPMPKDSTAELGLRYKIYFDFDGVQVSNPEVTKTPGFSDDMIVNVFRNPGDPSFRPWLSSLEIRRKVFEVKILQLSLQNDSIFISAQSPLFARDIKTNVVFSSGLLVKKQGSSLRDWGGQNTRPADLNTGTPLASAKPDDKPDDESQDEPSLGSLLKP